MITKPQDYETAKAYDGQNETIPVGGHICRILAARVEKSPRTNLDMLAVQIEIADGTKLDGYYHRRFDVSKKYRADAKWPGIYKRTIADENGNTKSVFKGLITAVEKSNPPYTFNWDENSLKGKYVGFNFGEEEYLDSKGEVRVNVKPQFPLTVERVRSGDYPILERKKLDGSTSGANVGGYNFTPEQPGPNEEKLPWEE